MSNVPRAISKLVGHDKKSRVIRMVLSTSVEDRVNDTIATAGWRLENYKQNPVVLWGHQRNTPPVGKSVEIGVSVSGLEASIQFATAEEFPLADTVYRLLMGGYLNAGSVGFRPLKHVWNDDTGGIDFLEQELLEYSIVTVPCNPQALVSAKAEGIDLAPFDGTPFPELREALVAASKAAIAAKSLGRYSSRAKIIDLKTRLACR